MISRLTSVDKLGVREAGLLTKGISGDKTTLRNLCIASRADLLFASGSCSTSFI